MGKQEEGRWKRGVKGQCEMGVIAENTKYGKARDWKNGSLNHVTDSVL